MCPSSSSSPGGHDDAPTDSIEPGAAPLAMHLIQVDGHAVLKVRGEIDPSTAERFGAGIDAAFTQAPRVVLDMRDVLFMDSTGFRVLIRAFEHTGQNRDALVLRDPSPFVQRLLTLTGLDKVMTVQPVGHEID